MQLRNTVKLVASLFFLCPVQASLSLWSPCVLFFLCKSIKFRSHKNSVCTPIAWTLYCSSWLQAAFHASQQYIRTRRLGRSKHTDSLQWPPPPLSCSQAHAWNALTISLSQFILPNVFMCKAATDNYFFSRGSAGMYVCPRKIISTYYVWGGQ